MGNVGGYTRGVDNIVESKVLDKRRRLEEEREGLANTARGTGDDCVVLVRTCMLAAAAASRTAPHLSV